jgi:hypothetical protein
MLDVVSTNILPSFRADYSSKEGAVETSISEIFGGKSLDITTSLTFNNKSGAWLQQRWYYPRSQGEQWRK